MPSPASNPENPATAARAPLVAIPEPAACPACARPLVGNQLACSARCRAALSRQRQVQAREARDREIRSLLARALRLLDGESS